MTKIRATQTLGATLTNKGSHKLAFNIYKKLINEALNGNTREYFTRPQQVILEKAIVKSMEIAEIQEQAWQMRSAIDTVYDECLLDYNDVTDAMPSNLHTVIKDTINHASATIATGDRKAGLEKYTTLLKQMKNNRKYRELVSPAAQKLVDESLEVADSADDMEMKTSKVRASLDRVYNEIRLPDVYSPSCGPLVSFILHISHITIHHLGSKNPCLPWDCLDF